MGEVPQVTGLRPMFGPSTGGTKLTIRGSALGRDKDDILDVRVCGVSVLDTLEYVSSSKLMVTTKPCSESGAVVVVTASGGQSLSQLTFVVEIVPEIAPAEEHAVGMMTEASVWCEEVPEHGEGGELNPADLKDRDPLQLGLPPPDDVALAKQRQTLAQLQGIKPDGSPLLSDVNFEPVFCLACTYARIPLSAFEDGLDHLHSQSVQAGAELKDLLNIDAGTFISAYETLTSVGSTVNAHRRHSPNGDVTAEIREKCTKVLQRAEKLYGPIIKRADKAQNNSNAKRFLADNSFLFDLPRNLHACIEANHWTQAVQDYKQSMVFFDQTKSTIVAKLVETVKGIADEMRSKLREKLADMTLRFSEKEKIIEHLRELDPQSDPAWFALEKQASFIMNSFSEMVESLHESLSKENQPASGGKRRWSQIRTLVRVGSAASTSGPPTNDRRISAVDLGVWRTSLQGDFGRSTTTAPAARSANQSEPTTFAPTVQRQGSSDLVTSVMAAKQRLKTFALPPRVQLVEKACKLFSDHMPVFWKLGEFYYPDSIASKRKKAARRRSTVYDLDHAPEEAGGPNHQAPEEIEKRRRQIDDFAVSIVKQFATVLREQFLDVQEDAALMDHSAHTWLPDLSSRISGCFRLAQTAGLPKKCLKDLEAILTQHHAFTVRLLFQLAETDIAKLSETWRPVAGGGHTQLPVQFQNIVSTTLAALAAFSSGQTGFDEANVEQQFSHTFLSLMKVMETETFEDISTTESNHFGHGTPSVNSSRLGETTTFEKRLLYTMTNAHYTRDVVAKNLAQQYDQLRLELSSTFEDAQQKFVALQHRCMEELVQLKSGIMVELLQENVPEGLDVLPATPQPRMYVKQVLRDMVLLHARVANAARGFTGRALRAVSSRIADTLASTLQTLVLSSSVVRRQMQLEAFVFATVLKPFDTEPSMWLPTMNTILSKSAASSAKKSTPKKGKRLLPTPGRPRLPSVPDLTNTDPMAVPEDVRPHLEAYIATTRFQYACFEQAAALDVETDSDVEV